MYTPVVPVGRTVNAAMTEDDKAKQAAYLKAAFRADEETKQPPIVRSSPSGKGTMPPALGRIMMTLHDELSKRTSGELPADFDPTVKSEWATPQAFDQSTGYDPSWLRYDHVDVYSEPLSEPQA